MKHVLWFLLCGCLTPVFAQPKQALYKPNVRLADTAETYIAQEVKRYIPDAYQAQVNCLLQAQTESPHVKHYHYALWFKHILCWGNFIKLSIAKPQTVYAVQVHEPDWIDLEQLFLQTEAAWEKFDAIMLINKLRQQHPIQKSYRVWHPEHGFVFAVDCWSKQSDYTLMFDVHQERKDSISHQRYFRRDTFVHAQVFNPDPLSVLGLIYGGVYVDDNDNNAPWFSPAYSLKKVPASFNLQTNQFALNNPWVSLEEFESPVILPTQKSTPDFVFQRNEPGFEEVMVMYHIMNFRERLKQLGYADLMNLMVHVDAHAQFGADNSVFVRNGGDPTLRFGNGGVDDAEDADVIVHEYAHGLSWSANMNNNFTFERSALDEGLADYWATSYSRRKEAYRWQDVFTWDGHNTFWQGRTAQTTRVYPSNGNIYQVGEIWNSVLSLLWSDLGADICDKLQLESMYFYTEQTTLPEAARWFIEADTLLFSGIHTPIICQRFQQYGILNANCLPTALVAHSPQPEAIQIANTYGFATQYEALLVNVLTQEPLTYTWYNTYGEKVAQGELHGQTRYSVMAPSSINGFCILELHTRSGIVKRIPLVRYP